MADRAARRMVGERREGDGTERRRAELAGALRRGSPCVRPALYFFQGLEPGSGAGFRAPNSGCDARDAGGEAA